MEQFHPNWRALATVPFQRKVFVKASSEDSEKAAEAKAVAEKTLAGSEVRAFYESVISEPASSSANKVVMKKNPAKKKRSSANDRKLELSMNVRESDLFKAALNDDVTFIADALQSRPELINIKDSYGWTLLMSAAKAGSVESVKYLVDNKADSAIVDKAGNSCMSLAINDRIRELLRHRQKKEKSRREKKPRKDLKCETCNLQDMTEESYNSHLTSTLHQFNEAGPNSEVKVHYVIPEANKGFQIMLNTGWQSNKGLGPPGKSGKLYPVKTVLKRDRHGLGLHETKPSNKKVTHFQPYDAKSVVNPTKSDRSERSSTIGKKIQQRMKAKETLKEVDFRREFM